jgi:hypothetical protein
LVADIDQLTEHALRAAYEAQVRQLFDVLVKSLPADSDDPGAGQAQLRFLTGLRQAQDALARARQAAQDLAGNE